jgi:hypothetical protein
MKESYRENLASGSDQKPYAESGDAPGVAEGGERQACRIQLGVDEVDECEVGDSFFEVGVVAELATMSSLMASPRRSPS